MGHRELQRIVERCNENRQAATEDEEAYQNAISDEALAIAQANLKDPLYVARLLRSGDLLGDTIIGTNPVTDFDDLVSMLLRGVITAETAREGLAQWLASDPEIMREAHANIDGEMIDAYDRDDQWAD
jgi:hypothetical protein